MNTPNFGAGFVDLGDPPTEKYHVLPYNEHTKPGHYKVTFVSMIMSNGTRTLYGIYRGGLCVYKHKGNNFIDLNSSLSERIDQIWIDKTKGDVPHYLDWAVERATEEYPAFNWGRTDGYWWY